MGEHASSSRRARVAAASGARLLVAVLAISCRTPLPPPADGPPDFAAGADLRPRDAAGIDFAFPDLITSDLATADLVTFDLTPPGPDFTRPPVLEGCDDGMQNGNESDVDCGGCCPRCAAARACRGHLDCQAFSCVAGRCVAPDCPHCGARLAAPVTYPVATTGAGLALGDVNNDGNADAVAGSFTREARVYLGRGDGSFAAGGMLTLSGPIAGSQSMALGDLNGDRRLDLVVGGVVYIGKGDGTFGAGSPIGANPNLLRIRLRDFNHDGLLDIVGSGATGVAWSLGNGDGTFRDGGTRATPPAWGVAAEDVTGDCRIDLLVATPEAHGVQFLAGGGDGNFAAPVLVPAGNLPIGVEAADVDGDRKADLIVGDTWTPGNPNPGATVFVLRGRGDGTFTLSDMKNADNGGNAITVGDLNGDGKLDVAIALYPGVGALFGTTLAVLLGNGDGTLRPATHFGPLGNLVGVALADLDGDRKLDVVVTDSAHGQIGVLKNTR